MLALGALSLGGSLLQGMGAQKASAKQARLQMIADAQARNENQRILEEVNAKREQLGRAMLATPEQRGVDTEGFMAAAERLGMNPVTYLNAGGLSSHGWVVGHNAEAAYKLMSPEYSLSQASQVPQQHSMLSALGAGLSAAGTAMGTQYRADQSYDLNMAKLNQSADQFMMGLSNTNGLAAALGGSYGGGASGASSATRVGGLSVAPAFGGTSGGDKKETYWPGYEQSTPVMWDMKKPESTNPLPPEWGWTIPPGFANAEAYEDAFAELVSLPYGIWKGANTIMWNVTGNTIPGHFRAAKDEVASYKASSAAAYRQSVEPYLPAGMPRSIAYPSWATP